MKKFSKIAIVVGAALAIAFSVYLLTPSNKPLPVPEVEVLTGDTTNQDTAFIKD